MPRVYIAEIRVADTVEYKIRHRAQGGCTSDEVREAFVLRVDADVSVRSDGCVAGFGTTSSGRRLFAALHPLDPDDGVWALRSAWPV